MFAVPCPFAGDTSVIHDASVETDQGHSGWAFTTTAPPPPIAAIAVSGPEAVTWHFAAPGVGALNVEFVHAIETVAVEIAVMKMVVK